MSFLKIHIYNLACLSVIVRENQAMAKDGGQPISLIFSAFKTYQIRLRLVVFIVRLLLQGSPRQS